MHLEMLLYRVDPQRPAWKSCIRAANLRDAQLTAKYSQFAENQQTSGFPWCPTV